MNGEILSYKQRLDSGVLCHVSQPKEKGDWLGVIVVAPGLSETCRPGVLVPVGMELAMLGYQTIIPNQPRFGALRVDYQSKTHASLREPELMNRATTLVDVIDECGLQKCAVVASSSGSFDAVSAAYIRQELITDVLLFHGGGMMGKDTLPALTGRFLRQAGLNIADSLGDPALIGQLLAYGLALPSYLANVRRTLREAQLMVDVDLTSALQDMPGRLGIIHSRNDDVFPLKRFLPGVLDKAHYVDFASGGRHPELWLKPRESANRIDTALRHLQAR